jgi:hypothetical protein
LARAMLRQQWEGESETVATAVPWAAGGDP